MRISSWNMSLTTTENEGNVELSNKIPVPTHDEYDIIKLCNSNPNVEFSEELKSYSNGIIF